MADDVVNVQQGFDINAVTIQIMKMLLLICLPS